MTTGVMSLPVHTVQVCSAWKVLFYFSSSLVSVDLLDSVFTGIGCVISTSWIVTIDTKWRNCHSQLYRLQRWWGLLRNSRIRLMIEFQDICKSSLASVQKIINLTDIYLLCFIFLFFFNKGFGWTLWWASGTNGRIYRDFWCPHKSWQ